MEWKHDSEIQRSFFRAPLETSLVEWKLLFTLHRHEKPPPLGNFLSGMETELRYDRGVPVSYLGNFLSGMETRVVFELCLVHLLPWKLP